VQVTRAIKEAYDPLNIKFFPGWRQVVGLMYQLPVISEGHSRCSLNWGLGGSKTPSGSSAEEENFLPLLTIELRTVQSIFQPLKLETIKKYELKISYSSSIV
jgi:hypothetical protein